MTETILWHEAVTDPAPSSDETGLNEVLVEMQLLSLPGVSGTTVYLAYKDRDEDWFLVGGSPLDPNIWKITYWAWKPEGPSELQACQNAPPAVDIPCVSNDH